MLNCPLVSKDVQVRWIGHAKCVRLCAIGRKGGLVWDALSESWCSPDELNGLILQCHELCGSYCVAGPVVMFISVTNLVEYC